MYMQQSHVQKCENHMSEDVKIMPQEMCIYRSGNFRLRFSPAMNAYLKAHQKDFMPEDTKAGQILDYLERYSGSMVCSKQLYKEALGHDYTIMRYLQYDTIQKMGLGHFDAWAASFGETVTAIELSPEGYTFLRR